MSLEIDYDHRISKFNFGSKFKMIYPDGSMDLLLMFDYDNVNDG